MAIFRAIKNKNYTIIHNGFLTDNKLSLKAKGLLAYFLSKPDDWNFYTSEISQNCKDGKDSISTAIKELISLGYVERFRWRDEEGKFVGGYNYFVYERSKRIENSGGYEDSKICESKEENINIENPNSEKAILIKPNSEKPTRENPKSVNHNMVKPNPEKPPLLNTESKLNTECILNTKIAPITKYNTNTKILEGSRQKLGFQNVEENKTKVKGWGSNSDIYEFYSKNGFGNVNKIVKDLLDSYINKYTKEAVKDAMIVAIKNKKYTLSYVEGILKNKARRYKENKGVEKVGDGKSSYEEDLRRKGLILDLSDL